MRKILLALFILTGSVFGQLIEQTEIRYMSDSLNARLRKASNFSDVPNKPLARTNLSVYSKAYIDSLDGLFIDSVEVSSKIHDSLAARLANYLTTTRTRDEIADSLSGIYTSLNAKLNKSDSTLYTTPGDLTTTLGSYFLTSNFNSYFDTRYGTKTLDSISAGAVNVHLTTALKSTYDGYATTLNGKANITDVDSLSRLAMSSTITGIPYNNATGVFSLTATYFIPTDSMASVWDNKTDTTDVNNLITSGLTGYFLTSSFPSYFTTQFATKTLDSLAAGTVNVHLTTTLKNTYDGYAATIGGKLDTLNATSTLRAQWTQAYNWGDHATAGYADSTWVVTQLVGKQDTTFLSGITSNIQSQINGKEPTISILSIAKGGTNNSSPGQNKFLFYNGTKILASGYDSTSFIPSGYLDTDTTLSNNSDSKIPSQKAVMAFVDSVNNGHAAFANNGYMVQDVDKLVIWNDSSGYGDIFLPAGTQYREITFKKEHDTDTTLTLYPDGSETIDDSTLYVVNKIVTITFVRGNWYIRNGKEYNLSAGAYSYDFTSFHNNYRLSIDTINNKIIGIASTGSVGDADSLGGKPASDYLEWADTTSSIATQADLDALPVLSDGDYNDITISGSGSSFTIRPDSVAFSMIQNFNTMKVLGRTTIGTGDPGEVSILDEDNMASDSPTSLVTQQSVKAYADTKLAKSDSASLYYSQGDVNSLLSVKRSLSDHDSLSTLDEKSYNSLDDKPTLGDLAALSSADTSKTQAKVISVNTKVGVVTLTTADIDTASNKKYVTLQEKNTWDGKVDKSDSTDATSYTTKKQFNDGQLLDVKKADSTGVNGYATQDDLGAKVNKADSTGVNGYSTQDDLTKIKKIIQIKLTTDATAAATTDSLIFCIPAELNGMNLINADAFVTTVSSSGTPTFSVRNVTDSQEMLSTNITIDATEFTSYTAETGETINASYDDVAIGDLIKLKCTVAGTGTKGSGLILVFQKP